MVSMRISSLIGLAAMSLSAIASASVIKVTSPEHFDSFKSKDAVVVKFYATWCGPCNQLTPKYEQLANDPKFNNVTFLAIDIDKFGNLAAKHNVKGVPTIMFWVRGEEVERMVGGQEDFIAAASKIITTKMQSADKKPVSTAKEKPAKQPSVKKKKTTSAKKPAPAKKTAATCS